MKNKRIVALITGIPGQDGSYLAEFLLEKNYDGWIGCEYNPKKSTDDSLSWMKDIGEKSG